jgi:hypothetical protein
MAWIKIDDNLVQHPKILEAGDEAIGLWVRLLSYSARYLTDGKISYAAARAILGRRYSPVRALLKTGLLEDNGEFYTIHNYLKYNPSRAETLTKRERDKERKASYSAKFPGGKKTDAKGPVPVPVPVPNNNKANKKTANKRKPDPEVGIVFDYWKSLHPTARLTPKTKALITRRLKDYPVEDLIDAIRGIHLDPWEDRAKYLSLKYALKDEDSIERFREFNRNPPGRKLSPLLQACKDFANEDEDQNAKTGIFGGYGETKGLLPSNG